MIAEAHRDFKQRAAFSRRALRQCLPGAVSRTVSVCYNVGMTDHDSLFKRLLTAFLGEFLELFLPDVLAYIDLSKVTFLDKELPRH